MKILIVDDSKVMRALVRRALRRAGYGNHEVVEAADGNEGHVAFESERPGLVLSDWNMPGANGLELLSRVRDGGSGVPFIFVTTEGTPEMRAEAEARGATGFLIKPFTTDAMEAALAPHLE